MEDKIQKKVNNKTLKNKVAQQPFEITKAKTKTKTLKVISFNEVNHILVAVDDNGKKYQITDFSYIKNTGVYTLNENTKS
jgi:hypothetical protein